MLGQYIRVSLLFEVYHWKIWLHRGLGCLHNDDHGLSVRRNLPSSQYGSRNRSDGVLRLRYFQMEHEKRCLNEGNVQGSGRFQHHPQLEHNKSGQYGKYVPGRHFLPRGRIVHLGPFFAHQHKTNVLWRFRVQPGLELLEPQSHQCRGFQEFWICLMTKCLSFVSISIFWFFFLKFSILWICKIRDRKLLSSQIVWITRGMFKDAKLFHGNVRNFDMSAITDFSEIFMNAARFNKDLSSWDVRKATTLKSLFHGAACFNQNLSSWDIQSVSTAAGFQKILHGATSFGWVLCSHWLTLVDIVEVAIDWRTLATAYIEDACDRRRPPQIAPQPRQGFKATAQLKLF